MSSCMKCFRSRRTLAIGVGVFLVLGALAGAVVYMMVGRDGPQTLSQFSKPDVMPKYFAIDMDDTFYVEDSDKFKKNVEAFKKLKDNNITPFFCTGRNLEQARNVLGQQFFNETGYNGFPGVYANGSIVYGPDGNIIKVWSFSKGFITKFYRFAIDNHLQQKAVFISYTGAYSFEPLEEMGAEFMRSKKLGETEVITFGELKTKKIMSIVFPSLKFKIKGLKEDVDYKVKFCYNIFAQLTPKGVTKEKGLEVLLGNLQSNFDECAFVGDGDNDKEIMKACRLSFAVGNAKEEVKKSAKWVSDLNHDQGAFAQIVDALLGQQQAQNGASLRGAAAASS